MNENEQSLGEKGLREELAKTCQVGGIVMRGPFLCMTRPYGLVNMQEHTITTAFLLPSGNNLASDITKLNERFNKVMKDNLHYLTGEEQ